ncbi:hypothetical protein L1280_000548 [Deinococcus sp. HSC-46F16]|uniref:ATP-binding protein n=1 Tax=Deinococcus sp. HSC-46F16 TaxID=2910968 RepID=UPI00209F4081|nr:ATP-binding protein [Deinococcus sp. HSC-46F16]MCP2013420.1 hypothetical protein [Deinococcus sp. HSC-46F16]
MPERLNPRTVEGWRDILAEPRSYAPEHATPEERATWPEERQDEYDLARIRHHSNLPVIITPEMKQILRDIRLQLQANVHSRGTVCGAVITGPATYGKTTALEEVGRQYETWFRKEFPPEDPNATTLVIPVVKVGLPAKATTKSINVAIAEFYGAALRRRESTSNDYQAVIRDRVVVHRTQLIIVDDIHFLNRKARRAKNGKRQFTDKEMEALISINNHFKMLAEDFGVTFVFGGIDVDGTGLFDEGAEFDTVFSQIGGRMARHELTGFRHGSEEWEFVVRSFENNLLLDHHIPGTLVKLADYLHHRTNGSIGSLKNLLKLAATRAMLDKKSPERIDYALLQKIKSDRNAEENFKRHGSLYVPASKAKA